MTKCVVVAFHNYCWMWDHKYFNVMSDYFMKNYKEFWKDEVDRVYIMDSTWDFDYPDDKIEVVKVNSSIRYYDVYKQFLPKIKEDAVLFMDDDMVVYRKGIVADTFKKLEEGYDVVSIYDSCGQYSFPELGGKNKFCPYWFCAKVKDLLEYRYCEWGPNMPMHETIGEVTKEMLLKGLKPYEIEEDKSDTKDLGYSHIRAGSSIPYLLTTKHYGNIDTYWEYLKGQPESETLRLCGWFDRMDGDSSEIRKDLNEKNNSATN